MFVNDILRVYKRNRHFLFADDLKLLSKIRDTTHSETIQSNLDALCISNATNFMDIPKCQVLSLLG